MFYKKSWIKKLISFLFFTEELREHFGQYGEIESINVKTDPQTGRSRGFAFIVYAAAESIDKVSAVGDHIINNKKVDPKKAKARHGKIFVGGLAPEISDDEIKAFFGQFGNVSCSSLLNYLFSINFKICPNQSIIGFEPIKTKIHTF